MIACDDVMDNLRQTTVHPCDGNLLGGKRSRNIQAHVLVPIERSQLRWFGHITKIPPCQLLLEVYEEHPTVQRPQVIQVN